MHKLPAQLQILLVGNRKEKKLDPPVSLEVFVAGREVALAESKNVIGEIARRVVARMSENWREKCILLHFI